MLEAYEVFSRPRKPDAFIKKHELECRSSICHIRQHRGEEESKSGGDHQSQRIVIDLHQRPTAAVESDTPKFKLADFGSLVEVDFGANLDMAVIDEAVKGRVTQSANKELTFGDDEQNEKHG